MRIAGPTLLVTSWQTESSFGVGEVVLLGAFTVAPLLGLLWLWMLIEAARWPGPTWERAGKSQERWLLRIIILGAIGALWYRWSARPALRAARQSTAPSPAGGIPGPRAGAEG